MSDLATQLSDIFKKGLESDPKAARGLASALSSHMASQSDGPYTKSEANYHTASDSHRECGSCDNFTEPSSCAIVSGSVAADGTCDYWSGTESTQSGDSTGSTPTSQDQSPASQA